MSVSVNEFNRRLEIAGERILGAASGVASIGQTLLTHESGSGLADLSSKDRQGLLAALVALGEAIQLDASSLQVFNLDPVKGRIRGAA